MRISAILKHRASHIVPVRRLLAGWAVRKIVILARTALVFGLGFTLVYPLLFMATSALRSREDLWNPSVVWITRHLTLEHIGKLVEVMDYPVTLVNTLLVSLVSALFQVLVCAIVGYGFARFRFRGREVLFLIVLLTLILPPQTLVIPQYMDFRFFHIPILSWLIGPVNLINTVFVFWIQSLLGMDIRSGLFIYIFRQFFRGMPIDLENAALIDGCGAFATFRRVMLPNAGAAMVTVFLFSFVWHWNDYYLSSIFLSTTKTLSVALAELRTVVFRLPDGGEQDPVLNQVRVQAGALLAALPLLGLFGIGQRYFTESVERTGIVG